MHILVALGGDRGGLLTQSMHVVFVAPASPAGGTEDRPELRPWNPREVSNDRLWCYRQAPSDFTI
jgi:hypothetical protein